MIARFTVESTGPLTTLQDAGRFGYLRRGVTWSGPVEPLGFAATHAALGNPANTTGIEVSHGGITLRCTEGTARFALAGGDFAANLDGIALASWVSATISTGQRLVVRAGNTGNWATLAFAGTIDCRAWLGSKATLALVNLGGGRLAAGDTLTVEATSVTDFTPQSLLPPVPDTGPIRVVLGPQDSAFALESLAALLGEPFTPAAAFDRMGMALTGSPLPPRSLTMLSSPVIRGAIQVNGAGTATILLADHQTTAGYPRIATVISADLPRAVQLRPGDELRFAAVTALEAVAIARRTHAARSAWLANLRNTGSFNDRLAAANLIDGVIDAAAD